MQAQALSERFFYRLIVSRSKNYFICGWFTEKASPHKDPKHPLAALAFLAEKY